MENTKYTPVDSTETNDPSEQKRMGLLPRNEKWQLGIFYAALATSIVCFLNLIITIWALVTHGMTYGSAVLYEGSCETTKNLNIGVHLIINIFSSAILSGSNYTMQCLSSPTRSEVDNAHARGTWLDIGVPSIRNLRSIAKRRLWIWLLLGVSSIPLHLFYNSVIFTTLSGNSYFVYITNEAWLSSSNSLVVPDSGGGEIFDYASGGEITITGGQDATNLDPYSWICGDSLKCLKYYTSSTLGHRCEEYEFCDVDALGIRNNPQNWTLNQRKVDYCLSTKTEEHCKLRLNATIAALVIFTNFCKALLIIITYFSTREHLLLGIGDAIVSFLSHPDPVTEGSSLLSKDDATPHQKFSSSSFGPRPFHLSRKRWLAAVSRRRTITIFTTAALSLIICSALLIYASFNMKGAKPSDIWTLGFGQPSENTLITFAGIRRRMIRTAGLLSNVLIANTPQLVLSFIYFSCNAHLTSMLAAREWSSFAKTRKGLRVHTHPRGAQRATYFLQLPWRYSAPMILAGALLHWLASQSIFVVSVEWWANVTIDIEVYLARGSALSIE
ncbi:hypothetical protein AA0120_g12565 [Alternaria tenuissima]|nr:hypothetical protein AA0120_g12565 [Alternaria tenuissima]